MADLLLKPVRAFVDQVGGSPATTAATSAEVQNARQSANRVG
jgi:hypothetical protein